MLMSNQSQYINSFASSNTSYPETMNLHNDPMMSKLQQFAVPLPDHLRLTSTAASAKGGQDVMQENFVPNEYHVICGRGKKVFEHCGNVRFRSIVMDHLDSYKAAPSKAQKSAVVSTIFDKLTQGEGAFIKQDTNTERWFVVSESAAREKISQCFRDCLQDKFKLLGSSSSTTSTAVPTAKPPAAKRKVKKTVVKQMKVSGPAKRAHSANPVFKKPKLGRSRTVPLTSLTSSAAATGSSNDAYSQLLSFSKSVMPGSRRRRTIPVTSLTLPTDSSRMQLDFPMTAAMPPPAAPAITNTFLDDMEPLPILHNVAAVSQQRPPVAAPIFAQPSHPDFEPFALFTDIMQGPTTTTGGNGFNNEAV